MEVSKNCLFHRTNFHVMWFKSASYWVAIILTTSFTQQYSDTIIVKNEVYRLKN